MNQNLIPLRLLAVLLLVAGPLSLRAAETNLPPALPANTHPGGTNRPTAAERRARIDAWRAERGGTNRTVVATPPENTRHLPVAERRARLRAKLDELRAKKLAGQITPQEQLQLNQLETLPPTAPAATNSSPVIPK